MAPPDPDAHGKIFYQEQESWELRISRGTGSYSVDTGGRTSSRGHKNLEDSSLLEARTPGCESSWRDMNNRWQREIGTSGCGDPEDTSQKMEDVWKGTETTEREGLDNMDWTEGHSDCRAGRDMKSKSVAER